MDADQDYTERRCRLMVLGMASRMATLAITNKNKNQTKKKKTMRDPPTLPKYSSGLAGVGGGTGELKV